MPGPNKKNNKVFIKFFCWQVVLNLFLSLKTEPKNIFFSYFACILPRTFTLHLCIEYPMGGALIYLNTIIITIQYLNYIILHWRMYKLINYKQDSICIFWWLNAIIAYGNAVVTSFLTRLGELLTVKLYRI